MENDLETKIATRLDAIHNSGMQFDEFASREQAREIIKWCWAEAPLPQSIQEALNSGDGAYRP